MNMISKVAPEWWDYTSLDTQILNDAARLDEDGLMALSRPGFSVQIYDSPQEFYCAEALEYIEAWLQATKDRPAGICGPIGPTAQLPLVAQMVNKLNLDLSHAHFWGMDEWIIDGKAAPKDFPFSFEKADRELCFDRILPALKMPESNLHFPSENLEVYSKSFDDARCVIMQGGQGEVKHWAFNDPLRRTGDYAHQPPSAEEYLKLSTRIVELHPMTLMQNARTSGGGRVQDIPTHAVTVGPVETWKAETVSIWHPGTHDNPMGMRLTSYMISNKIVDTRVPMSLLGRHKNVRFSFLRSAIGSCNPEMH